MAIVLVGVNHKTAPVEVRERLAFSDEASAEGLRGLVDGEIIREGLIVSTCNRVEVLTATTTEQLHLGTQRITEFLDSARGLPTGFLSKHLYSHTDDQAVRHLFRVASSLDSMVVGEPQVLGQVRRDAFLTGLCTTHSGLPNASGPRLGLRQMPFLLATWPSNSVRRSSTP